MFLTMSRWPGASVVVKWHLFVSDFHSDVNRDTTLTLGLQVVLDPRVCERALAQLLRLLLKLLNRPLVNAAALSIKLPVVDSQSK